MPATDLHVAALRSLLNGDTDETRRLMAEMDPEGMRTGYFPLLTGAFFEAVDDRFNGKKRSDMINWVAEVRAQRQAAAEELDPNVAERLILWVFNKASVEDLDYKVGSRHQAVLLTLLVEDLGLDDAGLDALLERAREFVRLGES